MPQQKTTKSKKQKGRKPAHQNTFAFKHNPKSKLTAQILASPNVGVCRRCHDKIEWRKKYRKYKPLTQPATCNLCSKRNVMAAYHTICSDCALGDEANSRIMDIVSLSLVKKRPDSPQTDIDPETEAELPTSQQQHQQQNSTMKNIKVCAICVKEKALPDKDEMDHELDSEIDKMEKQLGRTLKLREKKALERKLVRAMEEEAARTKAERRAARMREQGDADDSDNADDTNFDSGANDYDGNENLSDTHDDDQSDEEDPFLNAVGGSDKALVGEAYQQSLLQQEK